MKNVISKVVEGNRCCGCGVCAGIADKCNLFMLFNNDGEYVPSVTDCNECGLCLSICPSNMIAENSLLVSPLGKGGIQNYIAYSNVFDERNIGSSGGMVTRILHVLLEKKMVDGVVVIGSSKKKDRLFEPVIVRDPKELINYSGSKYYPIEISSIIEQMKGVEGSFAFVGLPCVIHGLRLVQKKIPKLGIKIKYLLGLVCGHNKNKNYTSALLHYAHSDINNVETVKYRCKEYTKKSSNFGFKGRMRDNAETKQLNFQESIVRDLWCGRYFSLKACFNCKDLFAVGADISFMDAWLSPYFNEPRGTSIVIVRNTILDEIIHDESISKNIHLEEISEEKVLESQESALDYKTKGMEKKYQSLTNMHISNILYSDEKRKRVFGLFILFIYICASRVLNLFLNKIYLIIKHFKRFICLSLKKGEK